MIRMRVYSEPRVLDDEKSERQKLCGNLKLLRDVSLLTIVASLTMGVGLPFGLGAIWNIDVSTVPLMNRLELSILMRIFLKAKHYPVLPNNYRYSNRFVCCCQEVDTFSIRTCRVQCTLHNQLYHCE